MDELTFLVYHICGSELDLLVEEICNLYQ